MNQENETQSGHTSLWVVIIGLIGALIIAFGKIEQHQRVLENMDKLDGLHLATTGILLTNQEALVVRVQQIENQ